MNFLDLCRRTVRESGTISGDSVPATTVNQMGRLKKFVDWTAGAWNDIQDKHDDWLWMMAQFSGAITQNTSTYTGASFGLTRHRKWIIDPYMMTIYKNSLGVADEGEICFLDYKNFLREFDRGTQTPNRPTYYTITPANQIRLGSVPDADYTLRGLYQKSNQVLGSTSTSADNTEVPELPSDYHMLIVWNALLITKEFDVGPSGMQRAQRGRQDLWVPLVNSQRPDPSTTNRAWW